MSNNKSGKNSETYLGEICAHEDEEGESQELARRLHLLPPVCVDHAAVSHADRVPPSRPPARRSGPSSSPALSLSLSLWVCAGSLFFLFFFFFFLYLSDGDYFIPAAESDRSASRNRLRAHSLHIGSPSFGAASPLLLLFHLLLLLLLLLCAVSSDAALGDAAVSLRPDRGCGHEHGALRCSGRGGTRWCTRRGKRALWMPSESWSSPPEAAGEAVDGKRHEWRSWWCWNGSYIAGRGRFKLARTQERGCPTHCLPLGKQRCYPVNK